MDLELFSLVASIWSSMAALVLSGKMSSIFFVDKFDFFFLDV